MSEEQPITQMLGFLRGVFGSHFKEYYEGDPGDIPIANLPCLVGVKIDDDMRPDGTGLSRVIEQLQVRVVYNRADDWSPTVDKTNLTEKKIRDVVEGRDGHGGYREDTIKYALMNRFRYNGIGIDQSMRFALGENLDRPSELITAEGRLTVTLNYLVKNPVRTY